jgi:hypothetical protein
MNSDPPPGYGWWQVECTGCGLSQAETNSDEESRAAWNRRTPTAREPAKVTEAMVEAGLRAVYGSMDMANAVGATLHDGARTIIEAALATVQPAEPGACPHCDGSGDVNRADGEWLGYCSCAAGVELKAQEGGR